MIIYSFKHYLEPYTSFYIGMVVEALQKNGHEVRVLDDISKQSLQHCSKDDWFITTHHKDIVKLWRYGYKNIINWFQGIYPEEDYMMHDSKLRYFAFNLLERFNLKHTRIGLFVSKYQIEHYIIKWHNVPKKRHIIPCFNETLKRDSFYKDNKYKNNVFCYAGSLYKWQCFNETLAIYKQIEDVYGDVVSLKIFTGDIETAQNKVADLSIRNCTIAHVPQDQLQMELSNCKYGFIIREENIVNNVATPTKMGNYLSNGVIPIITPAVYSFRDIAKEYPHIIMLDDIKNLEKIEKSMREEINPDNILKEYSDLFDKYYNREKYVKELQYYLSF